MIFQALFMRDMVGGSYARSLTSTFIPELLSMNLLMAGMVPTMMILKMRLGAGGPGTASFWFVMSMALLVGAILAYPMNWWLVKYNLKHGMMTVRPAASAQEHSTHQATPEMAAGKHSMDMIRGSKPQPSIPVMILLSFAALAIGIAIAWSFGAM